MQGTSLARRSVLGISSVDGSYIIQHLLLVIVSLIVNNVEETELVDTLTRWDDTEPVSELLLLEELLGSIHKRSANEIISTCVVIVGFTYKYLRYLPLNGMWLTTSILPSPACEMLTWSPKLPVRPSTLILSCRNFSKALRSKILSETGCEQLMVYYNMLLPSCVSMDSHIPSW